MTRKSSTHREFSIPGDELEQHRIQLEHNLQNTDLSLHLSSVHDETGDNESLEYPRHGSAPEHFPAFASFDRYSHENMDLDASHIRAWSIRDDEGIPPYDVRTMSTAAHHASAVTITAGLGRGGRREPSISGAEYDPERPLQDIIASCHAGSDMDEADRSQDVSRPKLSETLQRVGFSPRRPRAGQSRAPPHGSHGMPESTQRQDANATRRNGTPRVQKVSFDTTASRFTKMARGLAHDVRQAQEEDHVRVPAIGHRSVVKDGPNRNAAGVGTKKSNRSRVYLPDVTGLTNAVVSPAKANLERYSVRGSGSKEVEARLVVSLNALHTRLNDLETENSIARRRVRELEYELEECKRDVGKERRQKAIDPHASKYFEVVQEKEALEALISTLRTHLTRVTSDLSSQQQLLEDLRGLRESDALSLTEKGQEINQLRTEVERLAGEIEVLRGVVEEGLNERRQGRDATISEPREDSLHLGEEEEEESHHSAQESLDTSARRFIDDEEIDRISVDLDERRSERASNSSVDHGVESNPPFPKISSERMERLFFSAPRHNTTSCRMCKGRHHNQSNGARHRNHAYTMEEILERMDKNGGTLRPGDIPPQTVLARVIGELEDEFAHFREGYNSLSEEYKSLDCATQAAKRQVVGERLRDVIQVLERKGNQIASLYDLLVFKDKPFEL